MKLNFTKVKQMSKQAIKIEDSKAVEIVDLAAEGGIAPSEKSRYYQVEKTYKLEVELVTADKVVKNDYPEGKFILMEDGKILDSEPKTASEIIKNKSLLKENLQFVQMGEELVTTVKFKEVKKTVEDKKKPKGK
jgi:hypothetical protein